MRNTVSMNILAVSMERPDGVFCRDQQIAGELKKLGHNVDVLALGGHPSPFFARACAGAMRRLGFAVSSACATGKLAILAAQVEKRLAQSQFDVILALSTHPIALLRTNVPIVHWIDAVFSNIVGFYPSHRNLDPVSMWYGHRCERQALNRATINAFRSCWAAASAAQSYSVPVDKIAVVPPAVTFDDGVRRGRKPAPRKNAINCVIVGTDWDRKRGSVAVSAVQRAREAGIDATLTIIGMMPHIRAHCDKSFVEFVPLLNKSVPDENERFATLLNHADIQLLPSIADFSPNVVPEGYFYRLPVIASKVGAVAELVAHGETGYVIEPQITEQRTADLLRFLATHPETLASMQDNAAQAADKYMPNRIARDLAAVLRLAADTRR